MRLTCKIFLVFCFQVIWVPNAFAWNQSGSSSARLSYAMNSSYQVQGQSAPQTGPSTDQSDAFQVAAPLVCGTTAYLATTTGWLSAQNLITQTPVWSGSNFTSGRLKLDGQVFSTPALAGNWIAVATQAGTLWVVNTADGSVVLKQKLAGNPQGPLNAYQNGSDWFLAMTLADGRFYLVDLTQSVSGNTLVISQSMDLSSPSAYAPGGVSALLGSTYDNFYVPRLNGHLSAERLTSGALGSLYEVAGASPRSLAVSCVAVPGHIFIADDLGNINAVEPNGGQLLAAVNIAGDIVGLAWQPIAGHLIATVNMADGSVAVKCFDATLALQWTWSEAGKTWASSPVLSDTQVLAVEANATTGALVGVGLDGTSAGRADLPNASTPGRFGPAERPADSVPTLG